MVLLFFSVFFFLAFFHFDMKLLVLLSLEGAMLALIFGVIHGLGGGSVMSSGLCLCLVLLMVLDSVIGLTLLVCVSRNSSNLNSSTQSL